MSETKRLVLAALLMSFAFGPAATAEWLHYANYVSQAETASQKHLRTFTQQAVVPTAVANPILCASYENNHPKASKGNVASRVRIGRADGSIETMEFGGEVSANFYLECQAAAAPIAVGDQVTFDFAFGGFPRQKMKGGRSDFFSANGIVSDAGEPTARVIPPGVNPPLSGGHVYASISTFAAERDKQRHPRRLTQWVVVPDAAAAPVICAALGNFAAKANQGRVKTAVAVMHQNGTVTDLSFDGTVVDNVYAECKLGPSVLAGDVVVFDHVFKGLPRLRLEGGFFDAVATYAVVSPDGIPMLRSDR